jgi:hypothetical protein
VIDVSREDDLKGGGEMAAATRLSQMVQVSIEESGGTLVLGSINEFDPVRSRARLSLCFQTT